MNPRELIIERPDLQDWQQKAVFGVLTAVFWVIWVFLWLPLITLLGWLFFGYQFQVAMIDLEGYKRFLSVLVIYAIVIAAMGGSLMLWAKYNHLRFRGMDRRKDGVAPSTADLAMLQSISENEIEEWQSSSTVTVHHDDAGRIIRVVPATVKASAVSIVKLAVNAA